MIHRQPMPYRLPKRLLKKCVKLRSIFSRLDYLKGPIDSAINNFILQMLRQAQQKETLMMVGKQELVLHSKIK